MQGLINRAIELFVRDNYGQDRWLQLARRANLGFAEFEAMLGYDDSITATVLDVLSQDLGKPVSDVLEDIGTYLVSHPNAEALRRLLRFSGEDFIDFLQSLDDLPARAHLAVPHLELPQLELREHNGRTFSVTVYPRRAGPVAWGHVLIGLLRALADDYGALVLLDYKGAMNGVENIEITLAETDFAEGRKFALGGER